MSNSPGTSSAIFTGAESTFTDLEHLCFTESAIQPASREELRFYFERRAFIETIIGRAGDIPITTIDVPCTTLFPDFTRRRKLFLKRVERAGSRITIVLDASATRRICLWKKRLQGGGTLYREMGLSDNPADNAELISRIILESTLENTPADPSAEIVRAFLASLPRPQRGSGPVSLESAIRAIEEGESTAETRLCWRILRRITVLDADCGDGSWLLAAANAFAALYEAVLQRMRGWVTDAARSGRGRVPPLGDFRRLLGRMDESGAGSFIRRHIHHHNLRGVGRPGGAAECTRLRLALAAGFERLSADDAYPELRLTVLEGNPAGVLESSAELRSRVEAGGEVAAVLLEAAECQRTEEILRDLQLEARTDAPSTQRAFAQLAARRRELAKRLTRLTAPGAGEDLIQLPVSCFGIIWRGGFTISREE